MEIVWFKAFEPGSQKQKKKDFGSSLENKDPELYKVAASYGFISSSPASVERVFSYFNKNERDDRRLDPQTIKQLQLLNVNPHFL